jgi:hypothetical protein
MKKGKKNLKIDVPADVYSLEKHLYSLMFSGVYVSNTDIRNIMKAMGYDTAQDSRENLFELLFKEADKEGRKKEAYAGLMRLVQSRIDRYEQLASAYPGAARATSVWITKSQRTMERMKDETARLENA